MFCWQLPVHVLNKRAVPAWRRPVFRLVWWRYQRRPVFERYADTTTRYALYWWVLRLWRLHIYLIRWRDGYPVYQDGVSLSDARAMRDGGRA